MTEKLPNPPPSRLKLYLEIILLLALLPLFALSVFLLLRQKFDDDFWRLRLEKKIAALSGSECHIDSLQFSFSAGSVQIRNLQIITKNPDLTFADLRIQKLNAQINWWQTLTNRGLVADVEIVNWRWQLARCPRFLPVGAGNKLPENPPVNAADTLNWRETLTRWSRRLTAEHPAVPAGLRRLKNCRVELRGGEMIWRDIGGNLRDSTLTVSTCAAVVDAEKISITTRARLVTEAVPAGGELNFTLLAAIPPHARATTPADFHAQIKFADFDLSTLSLYYDFGYDFREQRFTLGAPFAGEFTLGGAWLPRNLRGAFTLANPRLLRVYPLVDREAAMPELSIEGALTLGEADEWQLEKLAFCVGVRETAWLRLDAAGTHRRGEGLDLQLNLANSFADFSQSELAKRLQLQLRGKTKLSMRAQTVTADNERREQVEIVFEAKDLRAEISDKSSKTTGSLASANAEILLWHSRLRGAQIADLTLNAGAFEVYASDRRGSSDLRLRVDAANFNANRASAMARNFELAQPLLFSTPEVTIANITVQTLRQPPFAVSFVLLDQLIVNYQENPVENSHLGAIKKNFFSHLPATRPYVTKLVRRAAAEKVRDAVESVTKMVISATAVAPPVPLHLRAGEVKLFTPGEYGDGMRFPLDLLIDNVTTIDSEEMAARIEQAMR